jgi:proline dehydrogenase
MSTRGAAGLPPAAPWRLLSSVEGAAEGLLRGAILAAAESPAVRRWVRRHGLRLGARRFVAGETFEEAVPVLRALNAQGLLTNTTLLGEDTHDPQTAERVAAAYGEVLERIAALGLRTNVALKLTHLGLALGEELAYAHLERLVSRARELGNFIRIDMEESRWVDATLRIYRRLRQRGFDNVGVVLQAYLYRSEDDLDSLLPLRPNLRIVKGAYREPPSRAYPRKRDVDAAYVRLMERSLREAGFTAIATHDERLIEHAIAFSKREGIPPDRFQFQMLFGVRPQLQRDLVARGYAVLVATPYGPDWYPYLMRRLAERPANVLFLVRNLVRA